MSTLNYAIDTEPCEDLEEVAERIDAPLSPDNPFDSVEAVKKVIGPPSVMDFNVNLIGGLVKLMRREEQQALDYKHLIEARLETIQGLKQERERHQAEQERLKRLLLAYTKAAGGTIKTTTPIEDGWKTIYIRESERTRVMGSCRAHPDLHFEDDSCDRFSPAMESIPEEMHVVRRSPDKRKIKSFLKEVDPLGEQPGWAKLEKAQSVVVR